MLNKGFPGARLAWFAWLVVAASLSLPALRAHAQLLVYPRKPSQTNVRYADFNWRYVDLMTHERVDIEWQRGPRFHLSPFHPPAAGTPWAWPELRDAPLDTGSTPPQPDPAPPSASDPAPATAPPAAGTIAPPDPTTPAPTPPAPGTQTPPPARPDPSPLAQATAPQVAREVLETAGGIRLYFYERERLIAERAAASIEGSYRYLAEQFAYAPRRTFAYFLYSSYIEFLQTDLFPVQEGVLGVTSTQSLELTLPYFGDHRLFEDVSTHELAHEFTIQKLLTVAREADVSDAPIMQMPLWFVEGLAEYYAKRGIDEEAEALVRDLVLNPTADGYVLGDFFEDRLADGLWTYKVGQVRCAFLEETYGRGTIQRILEESPRLMKEPKEGGLSSFRALVGEVTKERPSRLSARFERWLKRRSFSTYLDTTQDRVDMAAVSHTEGLVQTLRTSRSGHLLMYRTIDRETGTTSLRMFDRHAPRDDITVAADGKPGVESLHPVAGRNFDLTDSKLAFIAQNAGADVIYVQSFEQNASPEPCGESGKRAQRVCKWEVDFTLGERGMIELKRYGILAADAVALSPDGRGLAFIGLGENGEKDVYAFTDLRQRPLPVLQLTKDSFAEREVSWGPNGIVFTSDATGHGKYNVFRVDPRQPKKVERLTYDAHDQIGPTMFPDGRVLFVAYDEAGANIYEVKDGVVLRHTDVPTGLYDVSPGPDGSVWALYHKSHERVPVRLGLSALQGKPQVAVNDSLVPTPPRRLSLLVDREYQPLALENWSPDGFFILAGFSGDAIFGSLVATASDRLRDHGVILSASVFGSFDLTDAELTYVNQEQRLIWGLGVFHDASALFDESFEKSDNGATFVSYQRFFGVTALARWPFSRFLYVQGELSTGAAEYFVTDEKAEILADPEKNVAMRDLLTPWEEANDGLRFNNEGGISLGHSTIGYHRATGPISGNALLLSHSVGVQPFHDVAYQQTRVDAEQYLRIIGPVNFMMRGAFGTTFGDRHAPQYFLSSFHTLRGVPFGDTDYLLGREFFYSTVELQFPIVTFVEFPLIDLEGVLATDFGGVGDGFEGMWRRRVLDFVFGFNLGFAPLVLRIHFAQPVGIGAQVPNARDLTFNLSLAWRYN